MTTIAVIDTETTGLDPATASIVELACVTMDDAGTILGTFTSLVKPTCPIEFQAMAVHHITEDMVKDAFALEYVLAKGNFGDADCFVAHNATFDSGFLSPKLSPWICTWRLAQHLWPEAPAHGNLVLRYWLPGLDEEVNKELPYVNGKLQRPHPMGLPPHRALPDAWVTAHIFQRMLKIMPLAELIELSAKPVLLRTCWLGEHSGKPWAEVPASFLKWLMSKGPRRAGPNGGRDIGFADDVRFTAQHYIEAARR